MAGATRWTLELLEQAAHWQADIGPISRETIRRLLKNCLKPWRKVIWCINVLTEEYQQRMPVVCLDEKSKQLLKQVYVSARHIHLVIVPKKPIRI